MAREKPYTSSICGHCRGVLPLQRNRPPGTSRSSAGCSPHRSAKLKGTEGPRTQNALRMQHFGTRAFHKPEVLQSVISLRAMRFVVVTELPTLPTIDLLGISVGREHWVVFSSETVESFKRAKTCTVKVPNNSRQAASISVFRCRKHRSACPVLRGSWAFESKSRQLLENIASCDTSSKSI